MAVTSVTKEQLEAFKIVKDVLPTLWGEEAVLFTTNTECFDSMYTPPSFTTYTAKVGDRLAEGSGGKLCVTSGKPVDRLVPKEVYGFPFRTIALPVIDQGITLGSVAVARSREKPNTITEVADALSATSQQISASVQQMAIYAEGTVGSMSELDGAVKALLADVKTIKEMNAVIQNIASQTNLLALNAAIEAARAGEAGRGFAVVADEVKKLSVSSVEAVKKIGQVLAEVQRSIDNVGTKVGETIVATENQARTTRELEGAMNEVVAGAARLYEVSKTI